MLLRRLVPFAAIFIFIQLLTRLSLITRAYADVEFDLITLLEILVRGAWFDTIVAGFFLLPIAFYLMLLKANLHGSNQDKKTDLVLRFIFCFILLFTAVSEHLFWSEFTTRFNFIAVDYLIYTQEVIGNIVESYPLHWLLTAITVVAIGITVITHRIWPVSTQSAPPIKKRTTLFAIIVLISTALCSISSIEQAEIKNNAEGTELAANGIYNLFSAFWHNEISYDRFYITRPQQEIIDNTRRLFLDQQATFVHAQGDDLTRIIHPHGKERHKNIILVVMESMSADYMGIFGNKEGLTPNLDYLARNGLLFTNLFATGTRTVRGLEAITLSVPPTPGQSIIRRPGNDDLFSLGLILKDRKYDTAFIYGGYGYFDNMNKFFAGNGFDIIDRTAMEKNEVEFANVWGICDEDMFTRAIKQADQSFSNRKPFMQLIMTTSNHRPYTYPDGKIDIASHSGRLGGVKYADYSIGKLMESAKTKPWFKDTIFIFVADHTAGAGGKAELDPKKYHIPMIFYAPGFIAPHQRYEEIASQIDMAPTLLGLLNFSYYTKFFGNDVLAHSHLIPRAFISNFQKVAMVKNGDITVLSPKQKTEGFLWPEMTPDNRALHLEETITYYQSASWWKEKYKHIPTAMEKP